MTGRCRFYIYNKKINDLTGRCQFYIYNKQINDLTGRCRFIFIINKYMI